MSRFGNVLRNMFYFFTKNHIVIFLIHLVLVVVTLFFVFKNIDRITSYNEVLLKKVSGYFYVFYDKTNVSCNKYSNDIKSCTEASRNGRSCVWYGGCSACLNGGIDGKEYCEAISIKTPTPSPFPQNSLVKKDSQVAGVDTKNLEVLIPTSNLNSNTSQNKFDCTSLNKDFFGCVDAKSRASGCVWQSCKGGLCVFDDGSGKNFCE